MNGLEQRSRTVRPHRKPGTRGVRDATSMLSISVPKACTENSVAKEYLSAKFHLVLSLTRGDVPVTRKEEAGGQKMESQRRIHEEEGRDEVTNRDN